MFALNLLVLAAALVPGRDVARSNSTAALWHSQATWDIGEEPDRLDRVLIPGRDNQQSSVLVAFGSHLHRAAVVMVGRQSFSEGTLEVLGQLRVAGPNRDGETQAGRLYVGGIDGTGAVMQAPNSDVYISKSLRIGYDGRSHGTYTVQNAELQARQGILIGHSATSTGELHVVGGKAKIRTNALVMGNGDGTLVFESDEDGFTPIGITREATLNGTLKVTISAATPLQDEFKLLNLNTLAKRTGGFRRVMIEAPAGVHYELTYTAGSGNDISLVRSDESLTRFESWQDYRFESVSTSSWSNANADSDSDDLPVLGEYKLGSDPLIDEGEYFGQGVDSDGKSFIEFVERKDRNDVKTTAQWSSDGRVWHAAGLRREIVSTFGSARTIRVTSNSSEADLRFRLVFERLPDAGVRPHVLFMMVDDLNDWIEAIGGHPQSVTPNLNEFAARGVLFTNAHCSAPVCHASRTAILTGVAPHNSGIYENEYLLRESPVLATHRTIPEQFTANGYTSVGAGKLFHRAHPEAWSDYYPSLTDQRPDDPRPDGRLSGITGRGRQFDWGALDVDDSEMSDHKVATWVCDRPRSEAGTSPAFIGCGIYRPHLPFHVPAKWFSNWTTDTVRKPVLRENDLADVPLESYTPDTIDDHVAILAAGQWNRAIHSYLASIRFADAQVGRVLNALDNSDIARNTIVVLSSDHGWHLGTKDTWRKRSLWEESTRTPMLIIAPGTTTPGTRCEEFVSLLDLYPTLVELTGISEPARLDGTSLVPQLEDPKTPRTKPVLTTRFQHEHSVRIDRWRLSRYSDGSLELYDHSVDPYEWTNLADDPGYSDVIEDLETHFPTDPVPPGGSD